MRKYYKRILYPMRQYIKTPGEIIDQKLRERIGDDYKEQKEQDLESYQKIYEEVVQEVKISSQKDALKDEIILEDQKFKPPKEKPRPQKPREIKSEYQKNKLAYQQEKNERRERYRKKEKVVKKAKAYLVDRGNL